MSPRGSASRGQRVTRAASGHKAPRAPCWGPVSRGRGMDVNTLKSGRSDLLANQGVHALHLPSPQTQIHRAGPFARLFPPTTPRPEGSGGPCGRDVPQKRSGVGPDVPPTAGRQSPASVSEGPCPLQVSVARFRTERSPGLWPQWHSSDPPTPTASRSAPAGLRGGG